MLYIQSPVAQSQSFAEKMVRPATLPQFGIPEATASVPERAGRTGPGLLLLLLASHRVLALHNHLTPASPIPIHTVSIV